MMGRASGRSRCLASVENYWLLASEVRWLRRAWCVADCCGCATIACGILAAWEDERSAVAMETAHTVVFCLVVGWSMDCVCYGCLMD
jgi:hypothetical protein